MRKFIRKILKQINKDNLLKLNNIDPNKYNSDRVYKMIKKFKLPYNSLNKESVLNMIINTEKNAKIVKSDSVAGLLKSKTARKRPARIRGTEILTEKENLYSEKIKKRPGKDYSTIVTDFLPTTHMVTRARQRRNLGSSTSNLYTSNMTQRGRITNRKENIGRICNIKFNNFLVRRRNYIKKEDSNISEANEEPIIEENGEQVARNLNVIINKSVLFNKYAKEEEERRSLSNKSAERSSKQEFTFTGPETKKGINNL